MAYRIYTAIVRAVQDGRLMEPFTTEDFHRTCPGFSAGTYNAFLYKHRVGNLGGDSELFTLVEAGKFVCVRPFKYGL